MLLFQKLVDETQMPTTHEATSHHCSQSSYPSEPFRIIHFTMRHPVVISFLTSKLARSIFLALMQHPNTHIDGYHLL